MFSLLSLWPFKHMIHTDSSILLEYFSLFRNIKVLSYSILQSLIDVHCISELVATLQLFLSLNSINVFRREFSSARSNIFTSTWSRSFNNNDIFNCRTLFSPLSCSTDCKASSNYSSTAATWFANVFMKDKPYICVQT